jgi:hypothetical protein
MRIVIVSILFLLSSPIFILCQKHINSYPSDQLHSIDNSQFMIASNNEDYWSYPSTKMSIGFQSEFDYFFVNNHLILSLSHSISSFYYPLQINSTQIGLFNEFGVNNLSMYFEAGPELRLNESLYIIPKAGVSFAFVASWKLGIGFFFYYGGNIGYRQKLNNKIALFAEGGIEFLPIQNSQNIYFGKIGIILNLF